VCELGLLISRMCLSLLRQVIDGAHARCEIWDSGFDSSLMGVGCKELVENTKNPMRMKLDFYGLDRQDWGL
jgi:hypothetical protein